MKYIYIQTFKATNYRKNDIANKVWEFYFNIDSPSKGKL